MYIIGALTVECVQESASYAIICLTLTRITCLGKELVHLHCHLTYGLTTCALDFLLFGRSCLGRLVPRETRGRPSFMLCPTGMILLMMRPFLLESRRLGFCRATLIAGKMTLGSLAVYLQRPNLGGGVQSRWPASPLSPVLFLVRLPHSTCQL